MAKLADVEAIYKTKKSQNKVAQLEELEETLEEYKVANVDPALKLLVAQKKRELLKSSP